MTARTGRADLPLHRGHVPPWLASRMAALGEVLVTAIVHHYGRDELLRRLSHPFWFQSLGAVMGMDWHSSGITTSVVSALKRGLAPVADELGVYVCGGRGAQSRKTPAELGALGDRYGLAADDLVRSSRLVAKIDSAAVQDGFELYLHSFVVTRDGSWTVIQQGMNTASRTARRYHWLSESVGSFVDDPHTAIEGPPSGTIVNLADRRAQYSREKQLALLDAGPDAIVRAIAQPRAEPSAPLPFLQMPAHHDVTQGDVVLRRLHGALAAAAARAPVDFPDLLLTPGVGARTVEALALAAEVVHGAPCRFTDPARFAYAHGGKDRHPFPVPLRVYDETLRVMRDALERAKLGNDDRLEALKRLDVQAREMEREADGAPLAQLFGQEMERSATYGGRSIYGWEPPPAGGSEVTRPRGSHGARRQPRAAQLRLRFVK